MAVNIFEPLQHTLPRIGFRTVNGVFKFPTGGYVELKGAVQFDIDGVQPTRNAPEFGNLIQIERSCCCRHYFKPRIFKSRNYVSPPNSARDFLAMQVLSVCS